jgi:membrane protein
VSQLTAYRVYRAYSLRGGNLSAAGMSFQAMFATFAGVWVGFSIATFVAAGNTAALNTIADFINALVPGLLSPDGLIDPEKLISRTTLGVTSALSLLIVGYTSLNWLDYTRVAMRRMFDLPAAAGSFVLRKARDLGIALLFGLAIVISTLISLTSTTSLGWLLGVLGITDSTTLTVSIRVVTALVLLAFDTALLAGLIRLLSAVKIPVDRLWKGALWGGIGLGVLKVAWGVVIGGAGSNPLLAGFALLVGLLIWFNLVARIYLLAVAWIAIGMEDAGIAAIDTSQQKRAKRINNARRAQHTAPTSRQSAQKKEPLL